MNLRERYRTFLRSVDPQSPPASATFDQLYVEPPSEAGAKIARMLELDPLGTHLLLGGIGTGKSTQLHVVRRALEGADFIAAMVDAGDYHDLSTFEPDALVLMVALALVEAGPVQDDTTKDLASQLRKVAYKTGEWVEDRSPLDLMASPHTFSLALLSLGLSHTPTKRQLPSKLNRPNAQDPTEGGKLLQAAAEHVRQVTGRTDLTVLIDGLDRTPSAHSLGRIAGDVAEVTRAGIGLVVVAGAGLARGAHGGFYEAFEHVHRQPVVDVSEAPGRLWLCEVLARRDASTNLLAPGSAEAIAAASGGAMRDLITLARNAADAAWLDGAAQIGAAHVDEATRRLGEKLAFGLSAAQASAIDRVRAQGTLDIRGPEDELLLATGRVLDVSQGAPRHVVHPALLRVLVRRAA